MSIPAKECMGEQGCGWEFVKGRYPYTVDHYERIPSYEYMVQHKIWDETLTNCPICSQKAEEE